MFIHELTKKKYYTIREKIKYYSKRAYNDKTVTKAQKEYALQRLSELKSLNKAAYDEPTMIVTNDKHFGNGMSKPRACVVVGKDKKNRLVVCPVYDRTAKAVILDNDISHQVDGKEHKIADSEVYEVSDIEDLAELTENDKRKLKEIHSKK